jgi:transcriptional regulator with XRE-family HTH domain
LRRQYQRYPSTPLTGADLRKHRKAAGLTQIALARLAGVGRHAVQYWEAKDLVKPREHAPKRFCEVLGLPDYYTSIARAGDGVLQGLTACRRR